MSALDSGRESELIAFLHSKAFLRRFAVLMCALFAVGWVVLVKNENRIGRTDAARVIPADPGHYSLGLDQVSWEKDDIPAAKDFVCISGWIFKPGEEVDRVVIRIILKNTVTGECLVLPTDVVERTDITQYMDDGNNYDYSGFSVRLPYWDELDTDTDYEIIAQYQLNDHPVEYLTFEPTLKEAGRSQK